MLNTPFDDTCIECGRDAEKHLFGGRCPVGTTIEISHETLERVAKTGHPRLLKNVLAKQHAGMFAGVEIDAVNVGCAAHGRVA